MKGSCDTSACATKCGSCADKGKLIIRLGLGILMAIHGAGVVFGGAETQAMIGNMAFGTGQIGGILGGLVMLLGGIGFATGMFFKLSSAGLAVAMLVAAAAHISAGDPLFGPGGSWHAVNLFIVFVGMIGVGPGKMCVCCKSCCPSKKCEDKKECCGEGCDSK